MEAHFYSKSCLGIVISSLRHNGNITYPFVQWWKVTNYICSNTILNFTFTLTFKLLVLLGLASMKLFVLDILLSYPIQSSISAILKCYSEISQMLFWKYNLKWSASWFNVNVGLEYMVLETYLLEQCCFRRKTISIPMITAPMRTTGMMILWDKSASACFDSENVILLVCVACSFVDNASPMCIIDTQDNHLKWIASTEWNPTTLGCSLVLLKTH